MSEQQFYIRIRGKVQGPFSRAQLKLMHERGQFRQFHEISEDRQNWASASASAGLFSSESSAPAGAAAESEAEWYYVTPDGTKNGPVALDELANLSGAGTIDGSTLVWKNGMTAWVALSSPEVGMGGNAGIQEGMSGPARGSKRKWLAAGLVTAVVLLLAAGGVFWIVAQRKGTNFTAFLGTGSPTIADLANEKDIAGAVGLVVCGRHIVAPDGSSTDEIAGQGTCFAVSGDGHVLTNKHVVEKIWNLQHAELLLKKWRDEKLVDVKPTVWVFFEGEQYTAQIVHVSDEYDLAVLKVDRQHAPFFRLSSAETLARGKKIIAYGFPGAARKPLTEEELSNADFRAKTNTKVKTILKPRDFEFVMTNGIISRLSTEEGKNRKWIQHNASINPGNSGGPLLAEDGTVLGINTLLAQDAQGIFYSLSMPQLKKEIDKHAPGVVWD